MVPVRIKIHSMTKDSGDGPMTFVAYGSLAEKNGTTFVRYEESAVTGIGHGKYEHRQYYERGRNTSFNYVTPYLSIPMVVFTRLLTAEKGKGRWLLALEYDVSMDQQPNGRISLKIEIEEEEVSGH